MAYTPTVWVNGGAPAIDDTNLNHMETQYTQALADIPEDQAAGTPSERTLGTGALQAAAGDHIHTLQQISEAADHGQDVESQDDIGTASKVAVADTYEDTGVTLTMTPAGAKNAVVLAYGAVFADQTNTSVEAGPNSYGLRILADAAVKEELINTIQSDDGTAIWYEASRGAFTLIDGAASSTVFKTQWKAHELTGGHNHRIMDKLVYLHVVEVSI